MKQYFLLAALLGCSLCFAQRINPKGNWYCGAEIGENKNYQSENEKPESIQFGILTEYYFLDQATTTATFQNGQTVTKNVHIGGPNLKIPNAGCGNPYDTVCFN